VLFLFLENQTANLSNIVFRSAEFDKKGKKSPEKVFRFFDISFFWGFSFFSRRDSLILPPDFKSKN